MGANYTISLGQMKAALCCVYEQLVSIKARLSSIESSLTGGQIAPAKISGPDVSTYNDSRGVVGDYSWNPTLDGGTFFVKISTSPHQWVSDPRSLS